MSAKHMKFLAPVFLLSLTLAACASFKAEQEKSASDQATEVVESFYRWYLGSVGYDAESDTFRKPSEPELEARPELSTMLLSQRLSLLASFGDRGGYDPLICAQDVPTDFTLELDQATDQYIVIRVNTSFSGHHFSVRLEPIDGWQLVEVDCQPN